MTDQDRDLEDLRRVSSRYRELGAEEPPRALDDAIFAAARREAGARPGSPGHAAPQRWYASVAAAAVLVLVVAVTLHMQSKQPDIAQPAPAAKQPAAPVASAPSVAQTEAQSTLRMGRRAKSAAGERAEAANEPVKDAAKPMIPKSAELSRPPEPKPFPENRADEARGSASSVAGAIARQTEDRASREAVAGARAPEAAPAPAMAMAKRAQVQESVQAETPERELDRIADLRRQGRHDEADKALAEFRKRYPDFKISEAMRERIERR
jgi:hypothetical protein